MQEENMLKMSKMATPPIMDPHTANILICYLLYKIDKPVRVNHLYDIAVGSDIINYFAYQDSIAYLTEHDSVELRRKDDETEYYVLTENGIRTAKELRNYVGKAYRDKLVSAAFHYFARIKRESEVKINYIPLKKGYPRPLSGHRGRPAGYETLRPRLFPGEVSGRTDHAEPGRILRQDFGCGVFQPGRAV